MLDEFGRARALRVSSNAEADSDPGAPPLEVVLPARTILVAAGTQPNTVLGREEPQHVRIDGKYFQAFDESGQPGHARARHQAVGRACADEPARPTAAPSASSATCIPPSPATW